MNEIMTAEEINQRFPSEWVLVGDPETEPNLMVKRGEVLWHTKDREELYRKLFELGPKSSAILYTGKMFEDAHFLL